MKPSIVAFLITCFCFTGFSQSDSTYFLTRNKGIREVIEVMGNKAVALKLISFDTKYGKQWKLERIQEVDTLIYNNRGIFLGTNGELRIKNEGYTFHYIPNGERSKLKVHMKRGGYPDPNTLINSSYERCRRDSLEEVLSGVSRYYHTYGGSVIYYRHNLLENITMDYHQSPSSFRNEFEPRFLYSADSLIELHSRKSAVTDAVLKDLNSIPFVELDSAFLQVTDNYWEWSTTYCKEIVNGFAAENPARFCQWVEQTTLDKKEIYRWVDKRGRKSLKAFDTDSPVRKEVLRNFRLETAGAITGITLALSFYGGIGVGIANLIALNR